MNKKNDEKYPSLMHYNFKQGINKIEKLGGIGAFLIPEDESYIGRDYNIVDLKLINYLQSFFKNNQSLMVRRLINGIKYQAWEKKYFSKTLKKCIRDGIIKKNGLEKIIDDQNIISKGKNYDKIRIYGILSPNSFRQSKFYGDF